MSHILAWFDPALAAIERSACPNRDGPMMFTEGASRPAGLDLRPIELVMCDYAKDVAVKTNMSGWINSRELRPPN